MRLQRLCVHSLTVVFLETASSVVFSCPPPPLPCRPEQDPGLAPAAPCALHPQRCGDQGGRAWLRGGWWWSWGGHPCEAPDHVQAPLRQAQCILRCVQVSTQPTPPTPAKPACLPASHSVSLMRTQGAPVHKTGWAGEGEEWESWGSQCVPLVRSSRLLSGFLL